MPTNWLLNDQLEITDVDRENAEKDYDIAKSVWTQSGCSSLLDYMLVYMKLDVYLLADVFEAFRIKMLEGEGLDPLNFFGLPGIAWASAVKGLKYDVELLTDPEMYNFFQAGIRGGMTFVNKHHVKTDDETSLLYIDINNLYGWALSEKLPYGDFKWATNYEEILKECREKDLSSLDYGYELEVDMIIPPELHDKLDDLPVAPIKQCPPGSKVKKLLLTHEPKYNYVIHWRLLQMYIKLGVSVTKIHRAIKFKQANIFKEYILRNTLLRAATKCKFEKDYYKLLNNALYGKTVENLLKRMALRLVNTAKGLVTYSSLPNFRKTIEIDSNLKAVLLRKEMVTLDRPSYIGQVVLDLSKLRMYQLQYLELEKYRQQFKCQINIVAGDTDSFFLECVGVKREVLLDEMQKDELLDTSNYA